MAKDISRDNELDSAQQPHSMNCYSSNNLHLICKMPANHEISRCVLCVMSLWCGFTHELSTSYINTDFGCLARFALTHYEYHVIISRLRPPSLQQQVSVCVVNKFLSCQSHMLNGITIILVAVSSELKRMIRNNELI